MGCPPVRKIIHSLKLVDYLHVQADNPWYNYYIVTSSDIVMYMYCQIYLAVSSDECRQGRLFQELYDPR